MRMAGIFSEAQCCFRPGRLTVDMMYNTTDLSHWIDSREERATIDAHVLRVLDYVFPFFIPDGLSLLLDTTDE